MQQQTGASELARGWPHSHNTFDAFVMLQADCMQEGEQVQRVTAKRAAEDKGLMDKVLLALKGTLGPQ